jgi:hypothetical protein
VVPNVMIRGVGVLDVFLVVNLEVVFDEALDVPSDVSLVVVVSVL